MATVKKQAPKMMAGEMTGKMYKKSAINKIGDKQAKELDKVSMFGKGKMAPMKAKMADGGKFGMLSVKAGVDKNPKATFADKIAGAKKMAKSGTKLVPKKNSVSKNISNLNKARGGAKMKRGC